jgi:DNA-binding NtrC family response regulator
VLPWPGNVRQLRNEVQRAVALAPERGVIEPEMLSPALAGTGPDAPVALHGRHASLASAVQKLERDMIEAALERAGGNISETARTLGLTRRGLYLKMERLGVDGARAGL